MHGAIAEIIEHHRFIEAWLRGRADPGALGAFLDAHTPGFRLLAPGGEVLDARALRKALPGAHGSAPDLELSIRGPRVVAEDGALVAAAYEEHQARAAGRTARRSTVLFVRGPRARNGLLWHHLHETWTAAPGEGG
ncbi:DUF4440 domain-containing protein [Nocardiopsis baichengensis]|uniref:DUF4440 domain-containing protein n=1 Tax=Nocardiopsis baichengensis TaxID=280240 RepID=UPI000349EA28|nr:DUF4440 domain-containing protein [Nocardiopsis baichengensis]